ncbi:hypothetical protein SKAU_G00020910 [Synaphobranchus kaupii]|uniref:Integrase catalytic domain-containing protein n=1 Tax=Synaphobranchus kaupii TaxID=118154 RepID=A0A9Q1JD43_SYNKA|nr:hypothetical protein SKAU_G00020910 [Synaphobranchus kaupii]
MKVKRDNGCDWKTALDWALMAKNSMHNVHGYSPYQLVFGQNPNLPSVLTDKPPALEGTSMSTWIAQHISALHATRRAFIEAKCSERIRRALRKQLRPTDDRYETGDKVYYKRVDSTEWKGPGVVIGQDGVVIFVRHGGTYVRVHQSRLRKMDGAQAMLGESDNQLEGTENHTTLPETGHNENNYDTENESEEETSPNEESLDAEDNDNYSLLDAVKSTKSVTEKRLRLEISSIKELIHSGTIRQIMWSATKEQLADCLTKKGTSALVLLRALREGVWQLKGKMD